ncbi:MAG: hypothetical protein AB7E81_06140 [Hyphomicrobiaceae bacterium]
MSFKTTTITAGAALAIIALALPATARDVVTREDGVTRVKAPTTRVRVDEVTGDTRVRVRAPATRVNVDTERGHVRIRVPYYSGDIRW